MRHRTTGVFSALLFFFWLSASIAWAQTSTTGELAGVVTDPSGAAVPSASVHLRSIDKGVTLAATTNSLGSYRFALLAPGTYEVKVEASNFETITRRIEVGLGQTTNGDVVLSIGAASQTIEVNEQAPLLQTDNGNLVSTISEKQVQNLPNPGNDITYVAQTSPGVVMNTAAGFGNFAANGISGTSNLFTLNGMDNNDPYLNLNNSGATNLTLGQNEVQEVSVVSNGYGGQYNSLAGTNINYSTRSGGNQFHGRTLLLERQRAEREQLVQQQHRHAKILRKRKPVGRGFWRTDHQGQVVRLLQHGRLACHRSNQRKRNRAKPGLSSRDDSKSHGERLDGFGSLLSEYV